jgi:hypothetical protein
VATSSNSSTASTVVSSRLAKTVALSGCVVAAVTLGSSTSEPSNHFRSFSETGTAILKREREGDEDSSHDEFLSSIEEMRVALQNQNEERFQDGMRSALVGRVMHLVAARPYHSVLAFGSLLAESKTRVAVFAETMRWLPHMPAAVPSAVNNVIGLALGHSSGLVRDAAIVAAEVSGSARLVPALRRAAAEEPVAEFKADLDQLLRELEGNAVPEARLSR